MIKRKPDIIEAIKNPRLFGSLPRFKKLETWTAWLVVLKTIFGLPMTTDDLAIFHRHTGRTTPPTGGSKETYLIIGRRGGKSFISALITCFISCFIDFRPFISIGETLVVMCLARDKDQARIVFRYIKAILNHVPALQNMIVDQRADEIELTTGVTIMVKASDFGGVRGPTIACVVADEIAFWPSQSANPDDEVSPPSKWELFEFCRGVHHSFPGAISTFREFPKHRNVRSYFLRFFSRVRSSFIDIVVSFLRSSISFQKVAEV